MSCAEVREESKRPAAWAEASAGPDGESPAVRRGKRVASFPWSTSWMVSLARFLPPLFYDRIMTRMAARIKLPY